MGQVSMPFADRARKKSADLLLILQDPESALLAACGLKVVPVGFHCYTEDEIEALRILARRSDVLRADNLDWVD